MSFDIFMDKAALSDDTLYRYTQKRLAQISGGKLTAYKHIGALVGLRRASETQEKRFQDMRAASRSSKTMPIAAPLAAGLGLAIGAYALHRQMKNKKKREQEEAQ